MSFSSNIKDELYQIIGNSRHCQMAELVAVLHYLCREDEQGNFYIYTDHEELLQKKGFYAELYNSQFALA